MRVKGRILNIVRNIVTKKYEVTFSVEEDAVEELQEIAKVERLAFEIKPYREKRSLNANSYFHVLVDKISKAITPPMSAARVKNLMMARYGVIDYIDGVPMTLKANLPREYLLEHESLHTRFVKRGEDGQDFYFVLKPTHEMDSKEMSVLIDGVVEEAKALGITTETPAQLAELKARWGI